LILVFVANDHVSVPDDHVAAGVLLYVRQVISKSKVIPYLITSVGHRADPGFLAVSLQVT